MRSINMLNNLESNAAIQEKTSREELLGSRGGWEMLPAHTTSETQKQLTKIN